MIEQKTTFFRFLLKSLLENSIFSHWIHSRWRRCHLFSRKKYKIKIKQLVISFIISFNNFICLFKSKNHTCWILLSGCTKNRFSIIRQTSWFIRNRFVLCYKKEHCMANHRLTDQDWKLALHRIVDWKK